MGMRTNAAELSFEINEDIEKEIKQAAEISMGTDINDQDEMYIKHLAKQILDLHEYRDQL